MTKALVHLLAFAALTPLFSQTSGQVELRFFGPRGMTSKWLTPEDAKVIGFSGTTPVMVNAGGGTSGLTIGTTTVDGSAGRVLYTDGTNLQAYAVTGSGSAVLSISPVLVTPNLGTPSAAVLTNGTGLPLSTGVTGAGTGVLTALAVNVGSAGAFTTFGGAHGTPSSITLTNATGLPVSSGISGLGAGVATFLATPSSANLAAALTDKTGTGLVVLSTSPTLTTPALGTPSAVVLTNGTGLPIATGLSGVGTGVLTALAVNTGSTGAFVVQNGAGGTPSSITLTNATGLPLAGVSGIDSAVATWAASPSEANMKLITGGAGIAYLDTVQTFTATVSTANIRPASDNSSSLGTGALRYTNGYFADLLQCNYVSLAAGQTTFWSRTTNYAGLGQTSATPATQSFGGQEGTGSNITGGNLNIGTRGTGTGTSGLIRFQGHDAGASSSTLGTLVTILQIGQPTTLGVAAVLFPSTTLNGGTATTTKPTVLIEPTGTTSTGWSTLGTLLGINAASGFTGALLDTQVAGSRVACIAANGVFGRQTNGAHGFGNSSANTPFMGVNIDSNTGPYLSMSYNHVTGPVVSTSSGTPGYGFAGGSASQTPTPDTWLIFRATGHLGLGLASGTPASQTLGGQQGVGSNITGGNLNIGTRGTGTGTGGTINLQSHAAGASSSTLGTLVTIASAGPTGFTIGSGGAPITKVLTATASLNFDLTAAVVQDLTVTCTGAALGDVVNLGVPHASTTTTSTFSSWVSAADTVTIRCRTSVAGEDPASGTFRVEIIQH